MSRKNNSKNWLAFILIFIGVLLLLGQLNIFPFGSVWEFFWPTIFAIIGIKGLIDNPGKNTIFKSGLILFALLLVLRAFEVVSFGWEIIWPFILIGLGLAFFFDNNFFNKEKIVEEGKQGEFDIFTIFSGNERRVTSETFKGGSVTAVFGGAEIDLTQTKLEEDTSIDLTVAFGGVSLIIPSNWKLDISVLPLFGGSEDSRAVVDTYTDKKLKITGTVAFGGLEITDKSKQFKYH